MAVTRAGHTATLLNDGRVLIVAGASTTWAEVYDPVKGTFDSAGNLTTVRMGQTATLLPNGTVLIAGGNSSGGLFLATAEIYDPITGAFNPTSSMSTARALHTATLLTNGQVLIAGGFNSTTTLATVDIFDPILNTFVATGTMVGDRNAARLADTATLLGNGQVLLAGGGSTLAIGDLGGEIYQPSVLTPPGLRPPQ